MQRRLIAPLLALFALVGSARAEYVNVPPSSIASAGIIYASSMVCDGVTDNSSLLQTVINTAQITGAKTRIIVPPGVCLFASTVEVHSSNISIQGQGSGPFPNGGITPPATSAGTAFGWSGAANGTILQFVTLAAATYKNSSGGVSGIAFYSDNSATTGTGTSAGVGLKLVSWTHGTFSDLAFYEFTNAGLYLTTVDLPNSTNNDTQFNVFSTLKFQSYHRAGAGLLIDGVLGGPSWVGNTSLNDFYNIYALNNLGISLDLRFSDNNHFHGGSIFSIGAQPGIILRCSNTTAAAASSTTFYEYGYSSAVVQGIPGSCTTTAATENQFLNSDVGNGTPPPTVEVGASAYFTQNNFVSRDVANAGLTVGPNSANDTYSQRLNRPSTNSLFIYNAASDHVRLSDGTNQWGVGIVGGGLRFAQLAGSASPVIINNAVTMPGLASTSAAQTGTVCWATGAGNLTVDTTTTCLLSGREFKNSIRPIPNDESLKTVLALKPSSYLYNDPMIPDEQIGFIADEVATADKRLVSLNPDGTARAVRYQQLTADLAGAIQAQQKQIEELRARNWCIAGWCW